MKDYTFWILYSRKDENKVLVFKTKTEDSLFYKNVCDMNNLNPNYYFYECITGLGFKILSKVFFDFSNENLKSKEVKIEVFD